MHHINPHLGTLIEKQDDAVMRWLARDVTLWAAAGKPLAMSMKRIQKEKQASLRNGLFALANPEAVRFLQSAACRAARQSAKAGNPVGCI